MLMPGDSFPNVLVGAARRGGRAARNSGGCPGSFPYSESLQSLRAKRSMSHEHQKTSPSALRFPVVWKADKPELIAKTRGGILMNHKNALLQWSLFITKRPGLNPPLPPASEPPPSAPTSSPLTHPHPP